MANKIKITQIRSTIDRKKDQKITMRTLGITKMNHSVVHDDTACIRGMVNKVIHLVTVEAVK